MTKEEAKVILHDWSRGLVKKWEKTGLLDRLNDDFVPTNDNMAVLLESKPKQLLESDMTPEEQKIAEALRVHYLTIKGKLSRCC